MTVVQVESLTFRFPKGWTASKFDDWGFYQGKWVRMWNGIKAIDVLAVDPDHTLWLIEVKDYSSHPRTKAVGLAKEVARKAYDTLAALLPARLGAADPGERAAASAALRARRLRIVLHLEQPKKPSRLRRRAIDPKSIAQRLRQLAKPIDAHPLVVERARMGSLPWSVA